MMWVKVHLSPIREEAMCSAMAGGGEEDGGTSPPPTSHRFWPRCAETGGLLGADRPS